MSNPLSGNTQVGTVSSFSELIETSFHGDMNAICWSRYLVGDFQEIVNKLDLKEDITQVSEEDLLELQLSEDGILAREIILKDIHYLTDFGASPSLNLLKCYERDNELDFISTDVYSYHIDRSPIETDTFLCTYYGAASDIISNSQVQQKVCIPEIRNKLKALYDGPETEFENFLEENFFDLFIKLGATDNNAINDDRKITKGMENHPNQNPITDNSFASPNPMPSFFLICL